MIGYAAESRRLDAKDKIALATMLDVSEQPDGPSPIH